MARVVIKSRFNGPPDSGNGGYACGVVAGAVEGPSIVTLRKPPPLEREIGSEGRKLWSGSAVFDENGDPCAMGSAIWIALKTEQDDFKLAR